jgi:hypothetical protein
MSVVRSTQHSPNAFRLLKAAGLTVIRLVPGVTKARDHPVNPARRSFGKLQIGARFASVRAAVVKEEQGEDGFRGKD